LPVGLSSRIAVLWTSYGPAAIFVVVTTALLLSPILRYLKVGWKYKSQEILDAISANARQIYLERFFKVRLSSAEANLRFSQIYYQRFGRQHFVIPILIIIGLVVVEGSLAVESLGQFEFNFWKPRLELNAVALSALAGEGSSRCPRFINI
jgi:hypothetical protein